VLHAKTYTICGVGTKIGQIAVELASQNPWWRDTRWHANDRDLGDVRRTGLAYDAEPLDDLVTGGLYILRGPRRVGKTVAVKQQIRRLIDSGVPARSIVRIAADGWAAKDLRTMVQNAALPRVAENQSRYWFIDEISAVSGDWAQQIKWLRDNDDAFRDATVVLTGSNASSLTAAAGALAGRRGRGSSLDRTLLPIGFRTFTTLTRPDVAPAVEQLAVSDLRSSTGRNTYLELMPWIGELTATWEQYIRYGGFPIAVAAAARGDEVPEWFLDDVFQIISGDAFKHSRLGSSAVMALLDRLWESLSTPVNLASVGADVGVSSEIVHRHVDYLRDAFLLWRCPQRTERGWIAKERAQDKLYAIDPVVARLAHLRNVARPDIDPTVLTEMQIGSALRRAIVRSYPMAAHDEYVFFARTPTRKEIDFISSNLIGVAIEVKYSDDGRWRGEAATVIASEWDGIVATRNVLDLNADDAWAVPAGVLAYAIDS
jgi:uncharacterized protein